MELISDGSISNHITKKIYQFSFEFFLPKLFPNNSNNSPNWLSHFNLAELTKYVVC